MECCLDFLNFSTYICRDPKINDATQEPVNCTNYTAYGKTSRNMFFFKLFLKHYFIDECVIIKSN